MSAGRKTSPKPTSRERTLLDRLERGAERRSWGIEQKLKPTRTEIDPASFRDPSGFVFRGPDGLVYRQVNKLYESNYRRLMDSGLYEELTEAGLMVSHEEVDSPADDSCRILRPHQIEFISYPYEWSFSMYKDAALATLDVQRRAMRRGMTLKDASSYNIQFDRGKPVFIDTLSFEEYVPGSPWVAYGQFCSHFLAPIALMSFTDIRLQRLMETFIDGVPLDLAARLLPRKARLRPGLVMHLFLHAWMQRKYSDTSAEDTKPAKKPMVNETGVRALADTLSSLVKRFNWKPAGTEWADYYATSSYDTDAIEEKKRIVGEFIERTSPATVWDLGANTGLFSTIAAQKGARTIAFDIDPACVEICYSDAKRQGEKNLLALRSDLTNPSPGIGWAHSERKSFVDRGPADLVMMLALIHHLSIANNLPLVQVAEFAKLLCSWLIIEWVPKDDPQVRRLLRNRVDIFDAYTQESFEVEFGRFFTVADSRPVGSDGRVLYLLEGKG